MSEEGPAAVAVDVGSLVSGRLAWHSSRGVSGTDLDPLVLHVAQELNRGKTALGFACPTWVPVPEDAGRLGSPRGNEPRNRAWSTSSGASSMATGLAQICWVLRGVATHQRSSVSATVRPDRWRGGFFSDGARLLLWEALLTNSSKGPDVAVAAFTRRRTTGGRATGPALNLLASAAAWAGFKIKADEVHTPAPIYSRW